MEASPKPSPEKRRSLRCELVFTMRSALHHGQGSDGNVSIFRTQRCIVDGEVMDLPYVSGNSLKHVVIREPGVRHMLRVLDVAEGSLSRAVVHLLYSGGSLSVKGSTIDVGAYRALCDLVPVISLCGGALGNFMVESRVSVGDARPVCREHASRVPVARLVEAGALGERDAEVPVSHLYDVQMGTRHDPLRTEHARRHLAPAEREEFEAKKGLDLAKREAGEHADKGDSQQMLYERQVLAAGTKLVSRLYSRELTTLEEAALWASVGEWLTLPFLGAGKAVGNGEASLQIVASEPINLRFPEWADAEVPIVAGKSAQGAAAAAMLATYEDHLRSRRDEILGALAKGAA